LRTETSQIRVFFQAFHISCRQSAIDHHGTRFVINDTIDPRPQWFLFAFEDLGAVLGFESYIGAVFALLEPAETLQLPEG